MEINVAGRKMNVGDALTTHAEDRLEAVAEKYFTRSIDATATFSKEGHSYKTHISLHAGQGVNMQSDAEANDPYASFEMAADKVEKQLRRYKRRLKNHHKLPARDVSMELAHDFIIAPHTDEGEEEQVNGSEQDHPLIIAEKRTEIPKVTVGDAVMLMDLSEVSAFMFRNAMNDTIEVIFKRSDGNIGWLSPRSATN